MRKRTIKHHYQRFLIGKGETVKSRSVFSPF